MAEDWINNYFSKPKKKKNENKVEFTTFDWFIFIASLLLSILYTFSFINNLLFGTFYLKGKPEESWIITLVWLTIFCYAFWVKYKKYQNRKQ